MNVWGVRDDPEPTNPHDAHAIRLINTRLETVTGDGWLGFCPQKYSELLSRALNAGHTFNATIVSLPKCWGPGGSRTQGVILSLEPVSRAVSPLCGEVIPNSHA